MNLLAALRSLYVSSVFVTTYSPSPYGSSIIWILDSELTSESNAVGSPSRFRRSPIKFFRSSLQLAGLFAYQTLRQTFVLYNDKSA